MVFVLFRIFVKSSICDCILRISSYGHPLPLFIISLLSLGISSFPSAAFSRFISPMLCILCCCHMASREPSNIGKAGGGNGISLNLPYCRYDPALFPSIQYVEVPLRDWLSLFFGDTSSRLWTGNLRWAHYRSGRYCHGYLYKANNCSGVDVLQLIRCEILFERTLRIYFGSKRSISARSGAHFPKVAGHLLYGGVNRSLANAE